MKEARIHKVFFLSAGIFMAGVAMLFLLMRLTAGPMPIDPLVQDLFGEFKFMLRPEREGFYYHAFVATVFGLQAMAVFFLRKHL